MQVGDGMSTITASVGPQHGLRAASKTMVKNNCGSAVVYDPDSPGPSLITERDILVALGRGLDIDEEIVCDHMTEAAITATPEWSLERAAAEMSKRSIRHLVVVEGGGAVGILSMRDIIRVWMTDGATSDMDALK
ncbi:MAG: CBS domain-containing protein [Solirubrobacterales bacterium]